MKTWQKIKENPEILSKYLIREKVVDVIRGYFKKQGFHEVQTPILVPVPSIEPNLEVFETQLRTLTGAKRRAFLIMSPEYSIKKLLAAGIGNVFEITKAFRNEEEVSSGHNPEFTILEWYRTNANYFDVMKDFEALFIEIIRGVSGTTDISDWKYQGTSYDLNTPWARISVAEAFKKYAGVEIGGLLDGKKLALIAKEKGYVVDEKTTWEQIFYQIMFNEIEPEFTKSRRPVFLYDYPISQASLAKKNENDNRFAERFEVFLAGLELGNCFSELLDANEQENRFFKDEADRIKNKKTQYPIDRDLLTALKAGLPTVSGIAVGVDRLVMLAADTSSISETLFFPAGEMFDL